MDISILSDGKQGHLNQSSGLARAIIEQTGGAIHTIDLHGLTLWQKLHKTAQEIKNNPPHLLIAAGHGTHIPLVFAHYRFKLPTVVCMKPSLPFCLFDFCIVPEHDLPPETKRNHHRILSTKGALHPMRPQQDIPKTITLILIGGPSKDFAWDTSNMIQQVAQIRQQTQGDILLTTSRRTPTDFVPMLQQNVSDIQIVPVEQTPPGWVAQHLPMAHTVWVSMDSVSMVYEALSMGVPVGVLQVPLKNNHKKSRVQSGLNILIQDGFVTDYPAWEHNRFCLSASKAPLLEADRIAELLLNRLNFR